MNQYPHISIRKETFEIERRIGNWRRKTTRFYLIEPVRIIRPFEVTIPTDFKTDFASVPRFLWPLCPPHGLASNASIVHDFLYVHRIGEKEYGPYLARLKTDQIFLQMMLEDGVAKWQALTMYRAVRQFGLKYWNKSNPHNLSNPPL